MYGFTLIIILAFVGGVIAYIGDRIGMKVGRKRLTLFGLRPKHTGIIITIFTGIFISAASIAILTIASDDVRTALFEMKEIQETLANNQKQLEESIQIMRDMEISLNTIREERDQAEADLLAAQTQLEQARHEYAELQRQRAELEANYADLETNYIELADQFVRFGSQVRFGNVALRADEIIYAQVVQGGGNLNEIYAQLDKILTEADKIAFQLGARVDAQSQSAIMFDQDALDFVAHVLQQEQGLFVFRVVSETNTVVGEPVIAYFGLMPNKLIFKQGDVLAEITVDLDITVDIDRQILNLLKQANAVAVYQGMITNRNGGAVEVSGEVFINAIYQAREITTGKIKIVAKAMEDTFAAVGPMQIALDVIPLSQ